MIFLLPPAVPVVEMVALASSVIVGADSDCAKDSRDCFPSDRVGLTPLPESHRSISLGLIHALVQNH